ncbi:unnamed protein product [Gemmata massiliana]|uniref:Uncharacterized protein n=1 Tax=Gemmata massiliana TaxID=1210884 RepID=A0A6P2D467_9BACT|nr:hypothetical protein [Gemmata massiliana]VTR95939.1 unnamed protein product [Gemmata massiliana]
MKTIILGFLLLGFAGMVLTSPYWLFRELVRPNDEQLPTWMGDARARKKRLLIIMGILALIGGGAAIFAGLSAQ